MAMAASSAGAGAGGGAAVLRVKTISRVEEQHTRESSLDIRRYARNRSSESSVHALGRQREYMRAVRGAKLDRIFAKPLLSACDGHSDTLTGIATLTRGRDRQRGVRGARALTRVCTAAADGEVRLWDVGRQVCVGRAERADRAGFVRGVTPDHTGTAFFSAGDEGVVRRWTALPEERLHEEEEDDEEDEDDGEDREEETTEREEKKQGGFGNEGAHEGGDDEDGVLLDCLAEYSVASSRKRRGGGGAEVGFTDVDHHWTTAQFATSGAAVRIWDEQRSDPVHAYEWGAESMLSVRYNPAERCLIGSTGSDRSVVLYDVRESVPMRKIFLRMRSNVLAWNPQEPFSFVLANEDHCLYTFDMRKLEQATMIHKDHTSAVMDVAFSPTGREFVSGSYDRSIRIFRANSGRSREVYHTRRMQRVFCVGFSGDGQYVLSGSDDANLRIWRAQASRAPGKTSARQERKQQYLQALVRRNSGIREVERISKSRRVPSSIRKAAALERVQKDAARRREGNRRKHSRPDDKSIDRRPEKKRAVIRDMK